MIRPPPGSTRTATLFPNPTLFQSIAAWERSAALDDSLPIVLRNLAIAYYNKRGDKKQALALMEHAFGSANGDARLLMELDQLYKKTNTPHEARYERLARYKHLLDERDDLYVEWVTLNNQMGRYQVAKDLIAPRRFHPGE